MIRCTGLRPSPGSRSVGQRCHHLAIGRVRRVQTERGVYVDGPMCGRCWRELLAADAGPLAAAADPYAPTWVLRLVVSGGAPELTNAVAGRGSAKLPRSVRRQLATGGVRVPPGVGVLEVARWVRVSRHGHAREAMWIPAAGVIALVGVVAVVVLTRPDDGSADDPSPSSSSIASTTSIGASTSSMADPTSTMPETTTDMWSLPPLTVAPMVAPTSRATVPPATTAAPTTTAAPVVKTVSVQLGAGCTKVAYEAAAGVSAVVLQRNGVQVAAGTTAAQWSGSPAEAATWTARLTVSGAWSGSFQWEGC